MGTTPRHDQIPTYEGRVLARPEEELVDQGLRFDVDTLLSRRRMLAVLGIGTAGLGLAACGVDSGTSASSASSSSSAAATTAAAASAEIPDETAGPYPGDGSNGPDVLAQSGIVRSDIRSSFGGSSGTAGGVPMTLELTVSDLANGGVPFEGVAVYVWHCTREGGYSMYSSGVEDQNFLRGVQVADANGRVTFTSIFPACYDGRWPHIHFEVYPDQAGITDSTNVIATSQVALPQDVCEQVYAQDGYEASVSNLARVSLDSDNVFGDDDGAGQLATVTGDVTSGYAVSLAVGVDTTTTPTAGGFGGGGGRRAPRRPDAARKEGRPMSLGPAEIGLIVLAVMLLFGYKKLPDASRSLGRSLRIFKSEVEELREPARTPEES
jgi:TatA/E family protein of Tat protein translocase